jgi:hypothetical protein
VHLLLLGQRESRDRDNGITVESELLKRLPELKLVRISFDTLPLLNAQSVDWLARDASEKEVVQSAKNHCRKVTCPEEIELIVVFSAPGDFRRDRLDNDAGSVKILLVWLILIENFDKWKANRSRRLWSTSLRNSCSV